MRNFSQAPNFRSDLKEFGPHGSEGAMADKDTGWEPDPADVERRKKERRQEHVSYDNFFAKEQRGNLN